jgi:hypothetical protein
MLNNPSAIEGMIRCSMPPVEEGGSHPSVTAKIRISRIPLQKVGMLCAARTKLASMRETALSR